MINTPATVLFVLAAAGLLASPGPAMAAMVAVGRSEGLVRTLRFYAGLELELAIVAVASAADLSAVLAVAPALLHASSVGAAIYLLCFAWHTLNAPVGNGCVSDVRSSAGAGLVLGLTNPKAYPAFASLMASDIVISADAATNGMLKICVVVGVSLIGDMLWLIVGIGLSQVRLAVRSERALSAAFALAIVAVAGLVIS